MHLQSHREMSAEIEMDTDGDRGPHITLHVTPVTRPTPTPPAVTIERGSEKTGTLAETLGAMTGDGRETEATEATATLA